MDQEKMFVDVGAGWGDNFIQRARNNPSQKFVIIDPDMVNIRNKERWPSNLTWIVGKVDEKSFLPLAENTVDEINMDYVLTFLHGEEAGSDDEFLIKASKILRRAIFPLKKGKDLIIRESFDMVEFIKPILEKIGIPFSVNAIKPEEALRYSESTKDAALEFLSGEQKAEPFEIRITK